MKQKVIGTVIGALLFLGLGAVVAPAATAKADTTQIKGEVIDIRCYFEKGEHGAGHKACATGCAKAGNPIGLLTEKGDVYVLMAPEDHDGDRDLLIDHMADTVTVEGTLVKKGGVQVIYVAKMK